MKHTPTNVVPFRSKVMQNIRRREEARHGSAGSRILRRAYGSLTTATRRSYKLSLHHFDQWRAVQGVDDLGLTDSVLAEWLTHLHEVGGPRGHGLAPGTIRNRMNAVRFRESTLSRPDPVGPESKMTMRRITREGATRGKGSAKGITAAEVERIITTSEGCGDLWGLRDAAMVAVGFYAGLRIGEVVALRVSDILPAGPDGHAQIRVRRSKTDQGGQGAVVPFYVGGARRVAAWIEAAGFTHGPVFRAIRRAVYKPPSFAAKGLTTTQGGNIVKTRAEAAGIAGVTTHTMRRSFAQFLTERGLSIQEVARAGRWASPAMVIRYVESERANQSAVLQAFGERSGLRRLG